ncbi:Rhodanese-like protein [Gracilaria domingensis]|nr:Rhodanese-like protein [Gracilaria domingensis]
MSCIARDVISFGNQHNVAGRIRISSEGINGTFGGTEADVQAFHELISRLLNDADIDFKVSNGSSKNFPEGWKVRVCKELVTMGIPSSKASWKHAAPHLAPDQFRDELLQQAKNVVVMDVRNQYESAIGRFRGAVLPPIRQFSDFPRYVLENKHLFDGKRVLMYCTGGIRCERASAFLSNSGLAESVAQLRGGIDRFLNRFPDGGDVFEGKNLVFDTRMYAPVNGMTTRIMCGAATADQGFSFAQIKAVWRRSQRRMADCVRNAAINRLVAGHEDYYTGTVRTRAFLSCGGSSLPDEQRTEFVSNLVT